MLDVGEIKNQVFSLIQGKDNKFINYKQYSFACGVALNAILFAKDCEDNATFSVLDQLKSYNELTKIIKTITDIVEANVSYIEHLPQENKNLYQLILNFEPTNSISIEEFIEYMNLGLGNSVRSFETAPVTIAQYAKMHDVTPNAIRYHIGKNNIKSIFKINRQLFIDSNESYPTTNHRKSFPK